MYTYEVVRNKKRYYSGRYGGMIVVSKEGCRMKYNIPFLGEPCPGYCSNEELITYAKEIMAERPHVFEQFTQEG